jgi:ribonuclease P protein component
MLSKKNKILSGEFKKFFKKGVRNNSKNFNISIILKKNNEKPKYAVVVSKKILKTAVLRNKNKRIIYKILRQLYPQFSHIKYAFIFIKNDISTIKINELKKELKDILYKSV